MQSTLASRTTARPVGSTAFRARGPARVVMPRMMPRMNAYGRSGFGCGPGMRFGMGGMQPITITPRDVEMAEKAMRTLWTAFNNGMRERDDQQQWGGSSSTTSSSSTEGKSMRLAADLEETDTSYVVYADVPGIAKPDLKIRLSKERVLTVSGERKRKQQEEGAPSSSNTGNRSRFERTFGAFVRSFQLPEDADVQQISAKVADGVLSVTIAKVVKPEPEPEQEDEITIA